MLPLWDLWPKNVLDHYPRSREFIFSSFFLNWIYWGIIGLQNSAGFKCTTQQTIICALHLVPMALSKVSFCPNFSLLCPTPPIPYHPFPLAITTLSSVSMCDYVCVCVCFFSVCIPKGKLFVILRILLWHAWWPGLFYSLKWWCLFWLLYTLANLRAM